MLAGQAGLPPVEVLQKTGNAYAGLWYTWVVVLVAFLVTAFMLKDPVEGQWDKPAA